MDSSENFEGSLVLEKLAEIGKVEEFYDAIDSDDFAKVARLMRDAGLEESAIETVIRKASE
ncbi:MAG: hypothetical protein CME70_11545 [Halobacteriovorax sp.]|nr:hypothetical protein [Halobacteriovorax sp.]